MAASGVYIAGLVRQLQGSGGTDPSRVWAVRLLDRVTEGGPEHCAAITAAGGVPALVACLGKGSSVELLGCAAAVLAKVADSCPDSWAAIAAADSLPVLLRHLHSRVSNKLQLSAALLICTVSASHGAAVAESGGITAVIRCLGDMRMRRAATSSSGSSSGSGSSLTLYCSQMVQQCAAEALSNMAGSGALKEAIVAARGIPALVQVLRSSGSGEKAHAPAAKALWSLAHGSAPSKAAIAAAGAIPVLMKVLRSSSSSSSGGSEDVQYWSMEALEVLACSSPHRSADVVAAGGIAAVRPCLQRDRGGEVQEAAARLLASLCSAVSPEENVCPPKIAGAIAAAGAIPMLLDQLQPSSSPEVQRQAAILLCDLASSAEGSSAIGSADGIAALLQLVQHSSCSTAVRAPAVAALTNLAIGSTQRGALIVAAGGAAALVRCLRGGSNEQLQGYAATALTHLAEGSPEHSAAIAAAGGIAALQQLQAGGASEAVKAAAAEALTTLSDACAGQAASADETAEAGSMAGGAEEAEVAEEAEAEEAEVAEEAEAETASPLAAPPTAPTAAAGGAARVCAADGCGARKHLRLCGGCRAVRYCSEECSRAQWKAHRPECRRLQAAAAAVSHP